MARAFALACLGLLLLVLVAPGCGRSSLEPEVLDAGAPSACGPSTCPNGCCDASGVCRTGADLRACGSVGGRCSDCVANGFSVCTTSRVCGRDDPSCSSRTCLGCCAIDDGRLRCLSGTEPSACGRSGAECSNCADEGRACDAATRACGTTRCDATNCDGCCVGDQCLPGDAASACGSKGAQCDSCASGQLCRAVSGGGGRCEGTSSCGPQNCGGCCNAAGQCVTGTDTNACGKQGQQCAACGANAACVQDGLPNARTCQPVQACGPANCPGCCVGNQCVVSTTPLACGTNGQACKTCSASQVCDPLGNCVSGSECNPATCAGCCVGDICAVGTQQTACGTAGALCQNCAGQSPPRVCQAGSCQLPACGPSTCPNGCCSGNTCVTGTLDNACGAIGGGACTDCSASNQACQDRQCVTRCGPANCAGCCRANNTCDALGISNASCGQGGVACANCSSSGSFCNGLVVPRRCNNQQTTCPASYGGCPGVVTPIRTPVNVCTDTLLDTLTLPCAAGPKTATCIAAVAALPAACRSCLAPFNYPFEQRAGLYACAASTPLSEPCRRLTGCAIHCAQTSCDQCLATSESQCYALVNGGGGQCAARAAAANCANDALGAGSLCSQFSYANYGAWIRVVGDQFCGDGP
ncbi:MAG: hypothetical protein KF795_11875 [Labilithrix sp.]|nr:hypothetical protein [Labilithrix sp.]